jgi:hypothetical protein
VILDKYVELIEVGMEEAVSFLTTGKTERKDIITLCPVGSDVSSFECKQRAENAGVSGN